MKIGILLPDLCGGGAERVGIELANEFSARGFLVDMVLLNVQGELLQQLDEKVRVVALKASRARNALFPMITYLRHSRPDILIANMWPLTVIAPISNRMVFSQCSTLIVEHNAISKQYGNWGFLHRAFLKVSLALGFRLADASAGVSNGVADDASRLACFSRAKISTLYNPIPTRTNVSSSSITHAEKYWGAKKGRRVLAVGSLTDQKNQRLLLNAFHIMGDKSACLMFLGQGALESTLRALADDLGIAAQVVFAGFHDDPTPFYATADLFVLSSNYEGFGNVIVEAMGQGTPVVSTDCPSGPREILDNGKYGTLVPVGDVDALAKAMEDALSHQHDREALKQRAQDFSVDKAADAYLDLMLPGWRDMGLTSRHS